MLSELFKKVETSNAPVITASDAGVSTANQVKRFYNGRSIISGYLVNNSSNPVTVTLTYWVTGGINQTIVLLPNQTLTFENLPLEGFIGNASVEFAYVALSEAAGAPKIYISGGLPQDITVVNTPYVTVTNFPSVQDTAVVNTPYVTVTNFPSSINISNTPSVTVTNFPSVQTVSVNNFPATQAVSVVNQTTSVQYNIFTALPYTASATGKMVLLLVGIGSVANLIINSTTASLNAGNALVNGAWYEFETRVASGDVVSVANATFVKGFLIVGE